MQQNRKGGFPSLAQLKYLPKLLNDSEKRAIAISIGVLVLALAALTVRVWFRMTEPAPKVGGTYIEGLVGSPRFINPLLAPGNDVDRDVSSLLFSGLLKNDAEGKLVPDLAQTITVSEDHKVYTVALREDLVWHDSEPLTTDDIVYTIKTIQDPAFKSPLRSSFATVETQRIDDRRVSFVLKESFPSFLSALTVGIIPEHIWYSIPPAQSHLAEANIKPIGSGAYQFKTLTKDTNGSVRNITIVRNERYHGVKPYIREITFKFYADFASAIEALKNKNVGGLGFLPLEYKGEVAANKAVEIKQLNLSQYTALFFNPEKNGLLKDKTVRKALALAIDRDRIVREALQENGAAIMAPLVPGMSYDGSDKDTGTYNPAEAARLLDESGWKRTETSTVRIKDEVKLAVTLTNLDQRESTLAAAIIKENWNALDIETEVYTVPKNQRKDIIEPRNYQILIFGQLIASLQDLYAFWHSSQNRHPGLNLSVFANKDIDGALQALRSASDLTVQRDLYGKFQKKLNEETFAIFLYNTQYLYPISKKIKGTERLQSIASPSGRFTGIANWYLKTTRQIK